MTQEDKQLLLRDLCGRMPYGVKIGLIGAHKNLIGEPCDLDIEDYKNSNPLIIINSNWLPYLRPMSSMTEEEKTWYKSLLNGSIGESILGSINRLVDWLDANHFDHRGLIPMGLALEAPEEMYKTE